MKCLFVCNMLTVKPFLLNESLFVKMKITTFQNGASVNTLQIHPIHHLLNYLTVNVPLT